MLFNVSSLLKEHTGAAREFAIDDDVRIDDETHRLRGDIRLDRTPRGILVRGSLHGALDTQCSRCLKPITAPIEIVIEEEFIPTIDVTTGVRVAPSETEEEAYRISERHELDLREPVQQYWAMVSPMAPLCREDCAGICPLCGEEIANDHGCSTQQIDERWAKLAVLRDRPGLANREANR
jgi:uncharacterized protein